LTESIEIAQKKIFCLNLNKKKTGK
jgi:hypothetical protein